MKVLVTGATGFIGSHLTAELSNKGYSVVCLARGTSSLKWLEDLDVTVVRGDCEDPESLSNAVSDCEIIFHIAGLTKCKRPEDFFRVNAKGTENLLSQALRHSKGLRRFVYLSSLSAVGPSADGMPVNEDTLPVPVSDYGRSKLEAERITLAYKEKLPITIIRPPAVYGPRDRDFHVFYRLIKKGIFPYWGKCHYSLIYVDDLVKGLIKAAESKEAEAGTFFLSDGKIYSNTDIADMIAEAVGARGRKPFKLRIPNRMLPLIAGIGARLSREATIINMDKVRELSHRCWVCDSSKAGMKWGFLPKTTLKEGVAWTANWYRLHQWL